MRKKSNVSKLFNPVYYDVEFNLIANKEFTGEDMWHTPALVDFFNKEFHLNRKTAEYFYQVTLEREMGIAGIFLLGKGLNNLVVGTLEHILRNALLTESDRYILIHNHPSSHSEPGPYNDVAHPSCGDNAFVEHCKEAEKYLRIRIFDNIIVKGNSYYSYAENYLIYHKDYKKGIFSRTGKGHLPFFPKNITKGGEDE